MFSDTTIFGHENFLDPKLFRQKIFQDPKYFVTQIFFSQSNYRDKYDTGTNQWVLTPKQLNLVSQFYQAVQN